MFTATSCRPGLAFSRQRSLFLYLLVLVGVSLTWLRQMPPGRVLVGVLALVTPARADVISQDYGCVVSVLDGDTIEVLHNNHAEHIRLNGIYCPEKGQAYGKRAKHATSELVFGKEVTLQTHGKDKYGRTLADVLLPGGTNANRTRVKDDWCWWYRKYAPGDTALVRTRVGSTTGAERAVG